MATLADVLRSKGVDPALLYPTPAQMMRAADEPDVTYDEASDTWTIRIDS